MKKTAIYFFVPLIGVIIFGVAYWNFSADYSQREADRIATNKAKEEAARTKRAADAEANLKEQREAQTKRKEETRLKNERLEAEKELRVKNQQLRVQTEQKAGEMAIALAAKKTERDETKMALEKVEQEVKAAAADVQRYKAVAAVSKANHDKVKATIAQIEDAERKRAEIARLQAEAQAKK